MQNKPESDRKNCHNSELKITNCTAQLNFCRTGMWKTRWKLFNSTGKTGFETGLFHFFHHVFNMWKKSGAFTNRIALFCGKLFAPAKRQGTALQSSCGSAAGQDISAKKAESATMPGHEKIPDAKDKKRQFAGNAARLMLYFILDYHIRKSSGHGRH